MSYLPPAIRSAAIESASTGRAIRRDRYQASAPGDEQADTERDEEELDEREPAAA